MAASLVLVTGASRGFGRCLAVEFSRAVRGPMKLVLVARGDDIRETADVAKVARVEAGLSTEEDDTRLHTIDLADLARLPDQIRAIESLAGSHAGEYERAVMVHNGASATPLSLISDMRDPAILPELQEAMALNVTSMLFLSSWFASFASETFQGRGNADMPPATMVNISSRASMVPMASMSVYCAGKAARDAIMRNVAIEHDPAVLSSLSYGPGPMDTNMLRGIEESASDVTSAWAKDVLEQGKTVDPTASAAKCVKLALSNQFTNGSHVDFYDDEE